MFKPNGNEDRRDYGEMLMPPIGFRLEKAIGTTYSLDLESLTAVAICLGLAEDTDSKLMQNPIGMLNALDKVSDRILIFCEAGQIKMPAEPSPLSILLEKMVIPVALPKDKKTGHYPAFHPKTWVLSYVNHKGEHTYRFAVLSRNLTFDRSWDISFAMDSSARVEQKQKTKPVIDFLEYLAFQVHNTHQNAGKKRNMIRALMDELKDISFSLESKVFDENFEILPMGIGKKSFDMSTDILFCEDKNRADSTFNELVIMSPFLTGSVIEGFNKTERGLTDCRRTLITRRSELGKLSSNQVSNFDVYCLKEDLVNGESYLSDEDQEHLEQDIHAKIFLRRKYSDTDFYLGSMNASYSAIHKNVEMMLWLGTKNRYLNGEKFLQDVFCGDADGKNNPFERVSVENAIEDKEADRKNALERKIKDLCRMQRSAVIFPLENGKYKVEVTLQNVVNEQDMMISPFNSKQTQPLQEHVEFTDLELLQLSEFYEIIASDGDLELHRIIMIPTTGIPEEREQAVVHSVVKDRATFVEYIAFVLGDDYLASIMEEKQMGESGFFKQSGSIIPALYEKMLRTSLEAPERLKDIGYVLRMITDKDIIPDEFRSTYEVFCRTLKIK